MSENNTEKGERKPKEPSVDPSDRGEGSGAPGSDTEERKVPTHGLDLQPKTETLRDLQKLKDKLHLAKKLGAGEDAAGYVPKSYYGGDAPDSTAATDATSHEPAATPPSPEDKAAEEKRSSERRAQDRAESDRPEDILPQGSTRRRQADSLEGLRAKILASKKRKESEHKE